MWMISGFGALGCLVYWILILFYSGPETSFASFWLGAAAVLGLVFLCTILYRKRKNLERKIPLWMSVSGKTLLYLASFVFVLTTALIYFGRFTKPVDNLDYVIVLGTYEQSDYVTDHLKSRLDMTAEYLQDNETTLIIVSGGKTQGQIVPEAKTMSDYLIVQGISSTRIIQEKQSSNTKQSIWYSERLIPEGASVGIVTNEYNLYRTVQTAKAAGLENVYGIGAPCSSLLELNYLVQESFMVFFEKWMGSI